MIKTTITIAIPMALKKKAVKTAKSTGFNMSHFIRVAIEEKIKRDSA